MTTNPAAEAVAAEFDALLDAHQHATTCLLAALTTAGVPTYGVQKITTRVTEDLGRLSRIAETHVPPADVVNLPLPLNCVACYRHALVVVEGTSYCHRHRPR